MSRMSSLLSLVIPVYNEADSLVPLVSEIDEALASYGTPYEIVFVDDGSSDGSFPVMRELAESRDDVVVVKLRRNFGKAAALSHGFAAARGDVIVTMDGDRQDDPAEIAALTAPLSEGYDLVSGWKQRRQDPLNKTLPSKFFNWTVRKASGIPLHDFNCGLKSYKRDVIETISIYGELHRYIPVVAAQAGFRATEVKVNHRRRTAGRSKYGWQRYLRGYLDLLTVLFLGRYQHRPQHLFGGLGTLLILIGVLVELYMTIDKLVFGNPIGQRPLLLLGALLIIVGVQLLSLGLIGELIANSRRTERPRPGADRGRGRTGDRVGRRRRAGWAGRRGRHLEGRPRSCPAAVNRRRGPAAVRAAAGGPHIRAVAYFGTYEPDYPRNAVLIAGLREHGVEVHEFHAALPPLTAAEMAGARGAARLAAGVAEAHVRLLAQHRGRLEVDAVVVGYPGHFLVPVRPAARRVPRRQAGLRPARLAPGHLRRRPRPGACRRSQGRRRPRGRRGGLPPAVAGAGRHAGARRVLPAHIRARGRAAGRSAGRRAAGAARRRSGARGRAVSRSRCCSTASGARSTAPTWSSRPRSCSGTSRSASR